MVLPLLGYFLSNFGLFGQNNDIFFQHNAGLQTIRQDARADPKFANKYMIETLDFPDDGIKVSLAPPSTLGGVPTHEAEVNSCSRVELISFTS